MIQEEEATVKIVGKGHATCFERLLLEWFHEETAHDVIFFCWNEDSDPNDTSIRVTANKSVLAAASSFLAKIFLQNPTVDDDLIVWLVGYSAPALRAVFRYIYTGSLVYDPDQAPIIDTILSEFCIHAPWKSNESATLSKPPNENSGSFSKYVKVLPHLQQSLGFISEPPQQLEEQHVEIGKAPTLSKSQPTQIFKKILPTQAPVSRPPLSPQAKVNCVSAASFKVKKRRLVRPCIDVGATDGKDLVIEIPALQTNGEACFFIEKRCCFEETLSRPLLSVESETSSFLYWRKTSRGYVSTFIDVPGVFSTYKDRKPVPLDFPYSCPPVEVNEAGGAKSASFFGQAPCRTYSRCQRTSREPPQRLSFGGLKSDNIESVSQVGRKVHITTRCMVGLSASSMFCMVDLSDNLDTSQPPTATMSRLNLEHNYSFGETPLPVDDNDDHVLSDTADAGDDMEDYKRALHLAINEQRRQNRLKQRMTAIHKDVDVLKERAQRLLQFCRQEPDAHDLEPEFPEPASQPKAPPVAMVECDICHKMVKESWIKRHKQVQHSTSRPHLCEECGRTFVLRAQLRTHQHRQHAPRTANHLCSVCGRAFRFAHYLRRHMSMHAAEKPYSCKYCDKSFRLKPVLIKHIRTHTGEKPYKCDVCGKCFTQRTTYANHAKLHTKWREMGLTETEAGEKQRINRRLQCEFCSMTFRLELFLNLHRSKHTGETPQLPCPTCKETYPSIKELNQHRKSQHPETIFFCQLCPKSFTNKPNFDFHTEKHTNPNATKKKYSATSGGASASCTCDLCGKELKSRFALDYHIKGVHLGDRPFKCTYCPKRFAQKPSLDQHLRTHTGERPYKCSQCPSAFKQGQHLTAHMVLHTGERPFKCHYCPKAFPHKTTLYAHLRIHTNTRWSCQYCRKVLPSGAQLQRHKETCNQRPAEPILAQLGVGT